MKTSILISQFYRNPNANSILNIDEAEYQKCVDALIYSIIIPFKFLSSSGNIKRLNSNKKNGERSAQSVDILDPKYKIKHKTESEISKF
jgi:hypothetical protein